jgi:hypothetical protein
MGERSSRMMTNLIPRPKGPAGRISLVVLGLAMMLSLVLVMVSTTLAAEKKEVKAESSVSAPSSTNDRSHDSDIKAATKDVEAQAAEEDCTYSGPTFDGYVCSPAGQVTYTLTTSNSNCNWNVTINWGDGNSDTFQTTTTTQRSHQYAQPGVYIVETSGSGTPQVAGVTCTFTPSKFVVEYPTEQGSTPDAPTIQSRTPAPEQGKVLRNVSPTVTFSEAMNANSVTGDNNIQIVQDGFPVTSALPASVTCNSPCTTATINPFPSNSLQRLKKKTWYRVVIWIDSTGVKDAAGVDTLDPTGELSFDLNGDGQKDIVQWWFKTGKK